MYGIMDFFYIGTEQNTKTSSSLSMQYDTEYLKSFDSGVTSYTFLSQSDTKIQAEIWNKYNPKVTEKDNLFLHPNIGQQAAKL